jgi:hypothetical protein
VENLSSPHPERKSETAANAPVKRNKNLNVRQRIKMNHFLEISVFLQVGN